jgi:hypothetical protein
MVFVTIPLEILYNFLGQIETFVLFFQNKSTLCISLLNEGREKEKRKEGLTPLLDAHTSEMPSSK